MVQDEDAVLDNVHLHGSEKHSRRDSLLGGIDTIALVALSLKAENPPSALFIEHGR